MKFLSLWQPWAALCVMTNRIDFGIEKQIETRSWSTTYRGLIAIHATASLTPAAKGEIAANPHIQAFLESHGIHRQPHSIKAGLTFGAIIGVVELYGIERTETLSEWFDSISSSYMLREKAFGNYTPGRFGWRFRNQKLLKFSVPMKGAQGLRDLPKDIEKQVLEQIYSEYPTVKH